MPNPAPDPNPNPYPEPDPHPSQGEISCFRASSQKQALDLKRLQAEKAKYAIEAAEAQSKFSNALDEVRARGRGRVKVRVRA